jgi:hypothetical protein
MTMYHVSSKLEYLSAIERDGFYDYANELHEGKLLLGVRLSEVPLWELGSPANPVAFAIDLEPEPLAVYECSTAYLHGYRQWVVPARIVNQANRTLIPKPAACQKAMGHPAYNR